MGRFRLKRRWSYCPTKLRKAQCVSVEIEINTLNDVRANCLCATFLSISRKRCVRVRELRARKIVKIVCTQLFWASQGSVACESASSARGKLLKLSKSESCSKKNFFLAWRCPKIFFIILSILLTIASDWQIGSRAIETFQNVEVGLYTCPKCFCSNHKRFARNFSKRGRGGLQLPRACTPMSKTTCNKIVAYRWMRPKILNRKK